MFLALMIGLGLMALSGWLFYRFMINYGIPYEKFLFEKSNEFGVLTPKNWEEYKKFKKIEVKAQAQGSFVLLSLVLLFIFGMAICLFTIAAFINRM